MSKIENALQQLFDKHSIVFWYDTNRELREEFEDAWLVGVEKIEVNNNQLGVKYRVLREQPDKKFLLYFNGPEPAHLQNWLLDVQLAHGVFSADQVSLWMSELGLGMEFRSLVADHKEFFNAASRREAFAKMKTENESEHSLLLKMMAASLGVSVAPRLENILFALLDELAHEEEEKFSLLTRFNLTQPLWLMAHDAYGYQTDAPHINDFAYNLFQSCLHLKLRESAQLTNEALVFLSHWQDSTQYKDSFEELSDRFARLLNVEQTLAQYQVKDLLDIDLFKIIDFRILEALRDGVSRRTMNPLECRTIVQRRATTHWYHGTLADTYRTIATASDFFEQLVNLQLDSNDIADGLQKYSVTWYRVDQLYRTFIYLVQRANQPSFLQTLTQAVEDHYTNNFLLPLNNNWQQAIDAAQHWITTGVGMQSEFYERYVQPILNNKAKTAVIISDALRYEAAEELTRRIESEGRFSTEIDALLGMLPSYTQLGMAALLPNRTLEIIANGTVEVDGVNSAGLENRAKILRGQLPKSSCVLKAGDVMAMDTEERRTLFRDHTVVYVYHDHIDAIGGNTATEDKTFEAVETALRDLVELVKALRSANFAKILVTADHGFLYQHSVLDESGFADTSVQGKQIYWRNRRAVAGVGLEKTASFKAFTAKEAGLQGDYDILVAKSINRLRLKGAGTRFVHGGASLQEIIIPVILVEKQRTKQSDTRPVSVDRIAGATNRITTGQLTVTFYQEEPVTSKVLGITLRVGLYAKKGKESVLISDQKNLPFNSASTNARERSIEITLLLSAEAEQYNNQTIELRLDEPIPNTNAYREYRKWEYILNRGAFTLF